jgi:hypothetical protein
MNYLTILGNSDQYLYTVCNIFVCFVLTNKLIYSDLIIKHLLVGQVYQVNSCISITI